MNEITVTLAGNLVDDPELRYTPNGSAVANFRIASTRRYYDQTAGEWKDGDTAYLTCRVWRQAAENVAESLSKGSRVILTGRLSQRTYETAEGEKRTVSEIDVDEVGASLRSAAVQIRKLVRTGGGGDLATSADQQPF
jgi:single-strand DNA-binding protein